jgi:hypothetical protein
VIAERYAIEQQILVTRGKLVEDDDVEGDQIDERGIRSLKANASEVS